MGEDLELGVDALGQADVAASASPPLAVVAVIESTDGQSPSLRSQMRSLAERTKGKRASDRTK